MNEESCMNTEFVITPVRPLPDRRDRARRTEERRSGNCRSLREYQKRSTFAYQMVQTFCFATLS